MDAFDFSAIAERYERDAVVQRGAADLLLDLVEIGEREDVLDLGCGPGYVTEIIRSLTSGRVEGRDPSPGMIDAAIARCGGRVPFHVGAAEDLDADAEFDVVFCNSAFHWFRDPPRALSRIRRALRSGGRVGMQAPATRLYCPEFVAAMDHVAEHPDTRDTFARFRSPWFFLETADAYAALFEAAGLRVRFARIDALPGLHTPEGALRIFESAAVAGYLGAASYDRPLDPRFARRVREIVAESFRRRAGRDGKLTLLFRRVFVVAVAG